MGDLGFGLSFEEAIVLWRLLDLELAEVFAEGTAREVGIYDEDFTTGMSAESFCKSMLGIAALGM